MNNENTKIKMSPKDFFIYISVMITLYVSAFSLLALFVEYIDILFPDKLETFYRGEFSSSTRFSIASLIIIFPIYFILTKISNKDIRKNPFKKDIWIRKWLIYFTLFVAGVSIIVDLIILVDTFLGGEVTIRFGLKVLAVFIVTGAVFGYYLQDLKGKWEKNKKTAKIVGLITLFVVFAVIVSGFFIIGSPTSQRLVRFDNEKINDLQNIQMQIVNFWQNKERLPENLSELEDSISGFVVPKDRQNNKEYEYTVVSDLTFEFCADFNKKSIEAIDTDIRIARPTMLKVGFGIENSNWQHSEGVVCFERTIDPDLYPILRTQ